jgi:hypothetical protein
VPVEVEAIMFSDNDWSVRRVTGVLGVLFFIGMVVSFAMFGPIQPAPDDPISEIRDFYANDDSVILAANWVAAVTIVFFFLPFAAGLRTVLAARDVDGGIWSRTAFGIAVAIVGVGGAGGVFIPSAMLAFDTGDLDDSAMRLMLYADAYAFGVILAVGIALFLAANSLVVLRTGAVWRWLAWFGLVVAVLALIGAWWPLDGDPQGPLAAMSFTAGPLMALWVLLVSINLLRDTSHS